MEADKFGVNVTERWHADPFSLSLCALMYQMPGKIPDDGEVLHMDFIRQMENATMADYRLGMRGILPLCLRFGFPIAFAASGCLCQKFLCFHSSKGAVIDGRQGKMTRSIASNVYEVVVRFRCKLGRLASIVNICP